MMSPLVGPIFQDGNKPAAGEKKKTNKGSLLTVFFFAFSRKFHELQHFMSRFAEFFPPRGDKKLKNYFANCRQKARHSRTSGRHTVMSRVRRVSPLPTVRDRPGSSPASFPGHGWSQKAPCITRAPFVQSTEPTHRHTRDQHEIASYFFIVDGFVARKVVYSYAREARSPL